ncbi:MAG: PSD1 and planctomycete cytochrome C domain-containing protein [Planctomycetota bacterium]
MAQVARADQASDAFFENQVRPILAKSCQKCHGAKKQNGSLRLDSRMDVLRGGDQGPSVVVGDPKKSLLIQALSHQNDLRMPPKQKLSEEQIAVLVKWVQMGAPWPAESQAPATIRSGPVSDADRAFWSFRPVVELPPPPVRDAAWVRNDIDRFILAKLEAKGLKPAPDADRRTLIRRATFDLIGLPPTPEDVNAFLADESPDAYAKLVERLLASKHYGERWGRHWLDVVRYADTAGETADYPAPQAYLYRNYVIDAFNADKPYDEFVREQIAGDRLAAQGPREKYAERVIATGYLAISRRFGFNPEKDFHLTIQDTIDTMGQSFLGMSLGCARCHDHKFDAVMRDDYYALYGIFESSRYAVPGSESKPRPADMVPLLPPEEMQKLKAEADAKKAKAEPVAVAYAVAEGKPHNARIHKRGEPRDLGEEAPRRFLTVLGGDQLPKDEAGSGRLALAEWIARPQNPLTARVMVNRIWQHHFENGIVGTPNDFGVRGQRPTHPELLDYLAAKFQANGWSIKAMHRLIVLLRTYQLSGAADTRLVSADPNNSLLGRSPLRRLEAEAIRDAMLAISGKLDPSMGGPHPFPPSEKWGFSQHAPFAAVYETNRRSVYLMTQRLKRHPFLALFDGADTNASTPQRVPTTVPKQTLFLMNDPFVHEQAAAFAARIAGTTKDERERIRVAYEMALARPPLPAEYEDVGRFFQEYRAQRKGVPAQVVEGESLAALARTLFARNEFLFVQ